MWRRLRPDRSGEEVRAETSDSVTVLPTDRQSQSSMLNLTVLKVQLSDFDLLKNKYWMIWGEFEKKEEPWIYTVFTSHWRGLFSWKPDLYSSQTEAMILVSGRLGGLSGCGVGGGF